MDKNIFRNKYFIFILSFIIESILYIIFNHYNIGTRYLTPDTGIVPVLGLMFGPVAGLGIATSDIIFNIYDGSSIMISILDGIIMIMISIISFKLWYSLMNNEKSDSVKFNSTKNVVRYIIVMFIIAVTYESLIYLTRFAFPNNMIGLYTLSKSYEGVFSYMINMFDFSLIYGFIFITLGNICKIPFYSPEKYKFKQIIPFKVNKKSFITLLLFSVIYQLTISINYDNIINLIAFTVFTVISIAYALTPFESNFIKKREIVNFSLIEKTIIGFIIIIAMNDYLNYDNNGILFLNLNPKFETMITIGVFFVISTLISISHLIFIEKNITNPISELIETIQEFNKNRTLITNTQLRKKFEKYEKKENDIRDLILSTYIIYDAIEYYLKNLKKVTSKNMNYKTELDVANKIQTNILPINFSEFEKNKNIEIYGSMNPAKEVGGDFYDFFTIDEDNIGFVIGDVSGKGIPAALFMVKTITLIRNHSKFYSDISQIFNNVNNLLCEKNTNEYFVTSWLGKLNIKTGKLTYINAGHNQPLININKKYEYLTTKPNLVLAAMENTPYKKHELQLKKGDSILLYTDGITEANNNYQGFYGENRLKSFLNENKNKDIETIINNINEDISKFYNKNHQFDDTTLLMIKYYGDN